MNTFMDTHYLARNRILGALTALCVTLSMSWSFVESTATLNWPGSDVITQQAYQGQLGIERATGATL